MESFAGAIYRRSALIPEPTAFWRHSKLSSLRRRTRPMNRHSTANLTRAVSEHDHIRGPATALVTLLEYGDYECPYCGAAHPVVEELRKSLGDRMRFVFRNFPLTQIHPNAMIAAESAEAAGAHGKFWE